MKASMKKEKHYFTIKEANMIKSSMLDFQNELFFPHYEPIVGRAKYQLVLLMNNFGLKKADKYDYSRFVQKMIKKIDKIII